MSILSAHPMADVGRLSADQDIEIAVGADENERQFAGFTVRSIPRAMEVRSLPITQPRSAWDERPTGVQQGFAEDGFFSDVSDSGFGTECRPACVFAHIGIV